MKKTTIVIVLFIFTCTPTFSYAWGSKGHKLVAAIAKKCLDKSVIDSVQKYLGDLTFEDAAVWMDEIKAEPHYRHMNKWHYVNVEKDATYVKTKDPEVVNEIEIAMANLKDKSGRDFDKTNFNLKVIFHLIGDIHQPLHCGYKSDKGGNDAQVRFLKHGSNLHKVWDSEIIETTDITLADCLNFANGLSKEEKKKISNDNVESWLVECRELLPEVYNYNTYITQDYIDKNKPVIEKQLVKAGIRLAFVLHEIFKKQH